MKGSAHTPSLGQKVSKNLKNVVPQHPDVSSRVEQDNFKKEWLVWFSYKSLME